MPNPDLQPASAVRRRITPILVGLALLLALVAGGRLCVGAGAGRATFGLPEGPLLQPAQWRVHLPGGPVEFRGWELGPIWGIRANLLVLGVLVGSALALSGVALQALLRNSLAEPFILGLSTGAGVGAMLQMVLAGALGRMLGATHWGALAGAVAATAVVYAAGRRRGVLDPVGLLLVGVVLGMINGSLIMLLNYLTDSAGRKANLGRWMAGSLNAGLDGTTMALIALAIAGSLALLLWQGRAMDAATFADSEALSLGVNLPRLRTLLFLVASVLAAAAVVAGGPIGFIGLVAPHLGRLLLGPAHRPLLIGSALIGAALVVLADGVAFGVDFGQGLLPIGIFTALIGGPVFLWMLRPQLGRGQE